MKRFYLLAAMLLVASLFLTACGSSGPGPASWLDRPLNQTHHPLEPIEIMAHASSDNGVTSFEISIDGTIVHQASANGGRLEKVTYTWVPEEPGVYTVGAIATDSNGNTGGEATSVIYIGGAGQMGPNDSIGDCEGIEHIFLEANPFAIPPGECTIVFWEVIAPDHWPAFLDGEPVDHIGERPYCLEESMAVELIVETETGICKKWKIVDVDDGYLPENEPPPDLTVLFEAHPPEIQQGECSVLIWEVYPAEGGETILQGELVPFTGEKEVCPEEPTVYELIAVRNGMETSSFVTIYILDGDNPPSDEENITTTPGTIITVTPSPGGGVTSTPTPSGGSTNTPTSDKTPPTISGASVNPNDFIYNTNGSCSPTAFNFSVNVTDAGGISSVKLNWTGTGIRSGPENMYLSGGKYVNNLGLFVNTGTLSGFSITAIDNSGNISTINPSWSLDVEECGGGS
ncbi:MAG: hypothetical protein WBB64_03890 [Anaerolineales bacterium]